jgi:hypothetical protein
VTGGRVVGGVVVGGLVVGLAGDTEVPGAFPSPPPLVVASAIATTATIATTAMIAAMGSHRRPDLSSLTTRSVVTRAPQWGQNVAPGVSGSSHTRQRSVALTIRRPV